MRSLDRIDRQIIGLLQENARRSNKELAAAVGLAPSTCSERVRRLEDSGVFRGFHADVEPTALGIGLRAMVAVRLSRHTATDVDRFAEDARAMPEVARLWHVTGADDFLVEVVVRDADHLRQLAVSGFTTMPQVSHIETSLVFTEDGPPTLPDLTL
ncbi:MAG: Lrp/AsnC family transcriptional regulator [Acidimicrobiia bacterium]|nr:Lrp/AsnC family transcriptional regulator [Acidimicrobiia bacterium]